MVGVITAIIAVDPLWRFIKPLAEAFCLLTNKRVQIEDRRTISRSTVHEVLSNLEVLNGPFKGMKYPSLQSAGGAIYPKILGSYEHELAAVFERMKTKRYDWILDIGCAEGYYAVGLALMYPEARVYGYDTSRRARKLCLSMAKLNGTDGRLVLGARCTSEDLERLNVDDSSGLVFSDCEGFERHLFTRSSVRNLIGADVLIEIHDFVDISLSGYIEGLFAGTHDIMKIKSVDDLDKAKRYDFPEMGGLSLKERKTVLAEGRPHLMEWFFCESRLG
jgi:hypothetical protein